MSDSLWSNDFAALSVDFRIDDETVQPTPSAWAQFPDRLPREALLPDRLGSALSDFARLLMQLVIVLLVGELAFHQRVLSDALLLAIFVMALGWWLTVRSMRKEAKAVLKLAV